MTPHLQDKHSALGTSRAFSYLPRTLLHPPELPGPGPGSPWPSQSLPASHVLAYPALGFMSHLGLDHKIPRLTEAVKSQFLVQGPVSPGAEPGQGGKSPKGKEGRKENRDGEVRK